MTPIRLPEDECFPIDRSLITNFESYLNNGVFLEHSEFLRAILYNDLSESFGRAPMIYQNNIRNIISYVRQHIPTNAWGSREIVDKYIKENTQC